MTPPHPSQPIQILFVCMGNICRSPAAECVFQRLVDADGKNEPAITSDSAGTIGIHAGNPPDARMSAAGKKRDIEISGSARQVRAADFEAFDIILAMDEENLSDLREVSAQCPSPRARLELFCEYCTDHDDNIVPDPYYGGDAGFDYVLDLLEDGCTNLLASLRRDN